MPSLVRSKATRPCKPSASVQLAGSWMRFPGSMGVKFMEFLPFRKGPTVVQTPLRRAIPRP